MDLRQRVEILAKEIGKSGGGSTGDAYTKAQTDSLLSLKADKATTYTKTEVNNLVKGVEWNIPTIQFTGTEDPDTHEVIANFPTSYKSLIEAGKPFITKVFIQNSSPTSENVVLYLLEKNNIEGGTLYSYLATDGSSFNVRIGFLIGENTNLVFGNFTSGTDDEVVIVAALLPSIRNQGTGVLNSSNIGSNISHINSQITYNSFSTSLFVMVEVTGTINPNDVIIKDLTPTPIDIVYFWGKVTSNSVSSDIIFAINNEGKIKSPISLASGDIVALAFSYPNKIQ